MKICLHSTYITSCYFDATSVVYKKSVEEDIQKFQVDRITELALNKELATEIAVQKTSLNLLFKAHENKVRQLET